MHPLSSVRPLDTTSSPLLLRVDPVPPEVVSVRLAASMYPVANVRVMLEDPACIVPCVSILPVALIPPDSVTPVPYSIPSSSMFPKT